LDAAARWAGAAGLTAGIATWQDAAGGCDRVKTGGCGFHTASNETDSWWQVDLGQPYALDRIVVYIVAPQLD
jgi:hypothetical protein